MKKVLAALLAISPLLFALSARADSAANLQDARKLADGVMGSVGAGNYDAALKQLKPFVALPPSEFDVVAAQVASQLPSLLQRFGSAAGWEFIRQEQVGESLFRLTYIAKNEKIPLRWYFLFYRSGAGWQVIDFRFDPNVLALFPPGG